MSKHVVGVDQSYTSCGIVVLDENGKIVLFETKRTSGDDVFARSWEIASHIQHVARHFNADTIGIEGLAFAKFGNATRDLAGLQFTIVNKLRFESLREVEIISPMALKKFATGKGNVKKQEMVDFLPNDVLLSFKSLYKKTTGLYDVTDAYWIAKFILEQSRKEPSHHTATRKSEDKKRTPTSKNEEARPQTETEAQTTN